MSISRRLGGPLACLGLFGAGLLNAQRPFSTEPEIDFNRDIRPILSKCMTCHGPAAGGGAMGLRLDSFVGATKALADGNRAIVPGDPGASELIKRINATDPAYLMPPPDSHKTLSSEEKKLLHDWIEQGAKYKEHWAFVKPVRPPLPRVADKGWPKNPIDFFVLGNLEKHGLHPEPEADKATLLRRVSLDLTGLPPTPEELDAFLADRSGTAYEKAVDRILASPRYGERIAMDWMDYSRYADSNGYQADYERFQSRWRDWVIEAFNRNMPYDQFTVEQIAGDLLPGAKPSQVLATAFNRNHRINTEGGVIAEEWRVETVVDRVETTSAVWMGLTAGCARCHDHKYDPLTQKDFYKLYAYFNNVPETGSGEERPINHPPTMKTPTAEESAQLASYDRKVSELQAVLDKKLAANAAKSSDWKLDRPLPAVENGLLKRFAFQKGSTEFKLEGEVAFEPGRATGAVLTSDKSFLDLGALGDFERSQPFSFGAWVRPDGDGSPFSKMDSGNAFRGWELSIFQGRPQAHLIHKWPENGLKVAAKQPIPMGKWVHVFVTYDGGSKASGMKLYLDGKLVEANVENDSLRETIKTGVTTKIGRRTNSEFFKGAVDDFQIFSRELSDSEVQLLASTHPATALLKLKKEVRSKDQQRQIAHLWSLEHDAEYKNLDDERIEAKSKRDALDQNIPAVMVMQEMPKPRDCYVLIRGQYDKPGEKVEAGLPSFLPPMPEGYPNNRLGLAKWIVSPDNPLTARVSVNRLWERFFGNGIVSTVEDFGTRAEFPSNPELLDYLATEFVRLKWDLKAMVKQIVMSASYRQSSRISALKLEKDPENRLISRGPRFRLPGEIIRDQALFAGGMLNEKVGGPSVRPVMPEGVWDETNFYGNLRNYKAELNTNRWRRSLYTIWKRTAAPPNMLTFDVPSRETCRVRRARTDTPLQALTLMNDETFVEAARALAQRMLKEGGSTVRERLAYGFKCVLSRAPTEQELSLMEGGLARRIEAFKRSPDRAKELLSIGIWPRDKSLPHYELAAYSVTASTLLNLDEAVTKQ